MKKPQNPPLKEFDMQKLAELWPADACSKISVVPKTSDHDGVIHYNGVLIPKSIRPVWTPGNPMFSIELARRGQSKTITEARGRVITPLNQTNKPKLTFIATTFKKWKPDSIKLMILTCMWISVVDDSYVKRLHKSVNKLQLPKHVEQFVNEFLLRVYDRFIGFIKDDMVEKLDELRHIYRMLCMHGVTEDDVLVIFREESARSIIES